METILQFKQSDFEKLVRDIKEHITHEVKDLVSSPVEDPMYPKEAAKYLRITTKTLYNRINDGVIDPKYIHRSGGSVYFLKSELYQYIKNS